MKIYRSEIEAGLADSIKASASVACLAKLEPLEMGTPLAEAMMRSYALASEGEGDQIDLFYMKDILVSTGWNRNADIFDRYEMWNARHTPVDKPFNIGHNQQDIIGHMTSCYVVDKDLNVIADDTALEDLPDFFHIVSGSVIYRYMKDDDRREFIEKTIAEIKEGKWYVSMEALFSDFDYGVKDPDGNEFVIARNSESAFLTKHLRQYKGDGEFFDAQSGLTYTIGRVMKNIVFCGKGLVERPGNEFSEVLETQASLFLPKVVDLGYIHNRASISSQTEINTMADINPLQERLDALEADNRALRDQLAAKATEAISAKVTELEGVVASKDAEIANLNTKVTAFEDSVKSLSDRATAAESEASTVKAELATIKAGAVKASRLSTLVEKGAAQADAEKLVEQFAAFSDEQFASTVDVLAVAWKTPAPAPKADAADVIETLKPEPTPALATQNPDTNAAGERADKLQKFIGGFLKYNK